MHSLSNTAIAATLLAARFEASLRISARDGRARSCYSAHGNQKARLVVLVPPDGWRSAWTAREESAGASNHQSTARE